MYRFLLLCSLMMLVIVSFKNPRRDPMPVSKVTLENKKVKAIIEIGTDQLLKEEYYNLSASGKWVLVLRQFTPAYTVRDTADTQLWNTGINPDRFLVQKMKVTGLSETSEKGTKKAVIELERDNNRFRQEISLNNDASFFHIEVRGQLADEHPDLDYFLSAYAFNFKGVPEFVHSPGLKFDDVRSGKGRDQILGDRAFHSPAVVLQQASLFAALVPDLTLANRESVRSYNAREAVLFTPNPQFIIQVPKERITMPDGIDLNVNTRLSELPVITYGLMDAKVGYHTRFVREEKDTQMVRKLYGSKIAYGFDLLVNTVKKGELGYPIASTHVWEKHGQPVFYNEPHLAMPYMDYLKQVRNTVFFPIKDSSGKLYNIPGGVLDPPIEGYEDHGSWLEWESDNKTIGGFRCSAPFWTDVINNSVFWNQARDAAGIYYWGKELNDTLLLSASRKLINFCLSAPVMNRVCFRRYSVRKIRNGG